MLVNSKSIYYWRVPYLSTFFRALSVTTKKAKWKQPEKTSDFNSVLARTICEAADLTYQEKIVLIHMASRRFPYAMNQKIQSVKLGILRHVLNDILSRLVHKGYLDCSRRGILNCYRFAKLDLIRLSKQPNQNEVSRNYDTAPRKVSSKVYTSVYRNYDTRNSLLGNPNSNELRNHAFLEGDEIEMPQSIKEKLSSLGFTKKKTETVK